MHVQYVALCDQVIIGADGRPSLIGVVNDVSAPALPVTLPRLAFAARILFPVEEANRSYRVEVLITDPSGAEVGRPGGEIALPTPPMGVESVAVDIPLHFDLFELPAPGRYTFLLHVDGKPAAGAQLAVREAAQA